MNLKAQLKLHLSDLRITPAELSRRSGVSKQVISDWLAGKKPRSLEHLRAVATTFDTTVDHLCFGDGLGAREVKAVDIEELIGDQWISGLFEVRLRRVKK